MTAAADRLRRLAAEATPGPWTECGNARGGCQCGNVWSVPADAPVARPIKEAELNEAGWHSVNPDQRMRDDARLIALAPELALLAADMADALDTLLITREEWGKGRPGAHDDFWNTVSTLPALLARLDALTTAAGPV